MEPLYGMMKLILLLSIYMNPVFLFHYINLNV